MTTQPRIRISQPHFGPDVEALVLQVLRSGHVAQGPMIERFEMLCAGMAGSKHAVAVANGTVSLELAHEVAGIGPGDEVITSPLTFGATLNAILLRGAIARFVDVGDDFNLDPDAVESAIGPATRAIVPVHLYGLMTDMEAIKRIALQHNLTIIEDCAQAHGAEQNGKRAGSFGIGSFSFYATKNVTSAEGGVITTSDESVAARLRILRNQGMRARFEYVTIGHNYRMSDVAAAIAIPQMERLGEINASRNANAKPLAELLSDTALVAPAVPSGRTHVWHHFTVLIPSGCDRDAVIAAMNDDGVDAGAYYPKMVWDYTPYRQHPQVLTGTTPRAADMATRLLSIPVHPGLSESDLERVATSLKNALRSVESPVA